MLNLKEFRQGCQVEHLVPNQVLYQAEPLPTNKLSLADRDDAISQAVRQRYSHDRPRELASDIAGSGTSLLALPTGPAIRQSSSRTGSAPSAPSSFPRAICRRAI